MWLFLFIPAIVVSALFLVLIFGLLRAGRRADEGEERVARIITQVQEVSSTESKVSEKVREVLVLH